MDNSHFVLFDRLETKLNIVDMKKEMFTCKIEGSFRFIFRKSLPIVEKTILCDQLLGVLTSAIGRKVITRVNKGVLTIYDTPTAETITEWQGVLSNMDSSLVSWDWHFRY